jgi:tRNA (guanosine-2'-O-)-methyltransferase
MLLPFFFAVMNEILIEYLSQFVSERRVQLFDAVLNQRTRYITLVLEDIYQAHNASAVLRSCECFGIQDVHLIENVNEYRISPEVALGSNKWLSIFRYNQQKSNTRIALHSLKNNGYRIVATSPHKNGCNLEDFDLQKGKTALVLGSELNGLSEEALEISDEFVKIPMTGFTESLNISVTAAICVHYLTSKLKKDPSILWEIPKEEKQAIMLIWLRNSIKNSDIIEKRFWEVSAHKKKPR